ncbi:MAG TPA: hypothetical protein DDY45_12770, partial [Verrucomicrobiales bacterium]|nr:hypothetical protein [Verrucomicrobiales bacterium]
CFESKWKGGLLVGARGSWFCEIIEKGVFASRGDSSKGLSEGEEVYPYLVRGGKVRESYAEL